MPDYTIRVAHNLVSHHCARQPIRLLKQLLFPPLRYTKRESDSQGKRGQADGFASPNSLHSPFIVLGNGQSSRIKPREQRFSGNIRDLQVFDDPSFPALRYRQRVMGINWNPRVPIQYFLPFKPPVKS